MFLKTPGLSWYQNRLSSRFYNIKFMKIGAKESAQKNLYKTERSSDFQGAALVSHAAREIILRRSFIFFMPNYRPNRMSWYKFWFIRKTFSSVENRLNVNSTLYHEHGSRIGQINLNHIKVWHLVRIYTRKSKTVGLDLVHIRMKHFFMLSTSPEFHNVCCFTFILFYFVREKNPF